VLIFSERLSCYDSLNDICDETILPGNTQTKFAKGDVFART